MSKILVDCEYYGKGRRKESWIRRDASLGTANTQKIWLPQGTHNRELSAEGLTGENTRRAAWLHSNPVPMHMHTVFAKQTQVLFGDFYLWEPAISTPSHPPTERCEAAMMPFSETSRYYR